MCYVGLWLGRWGTRTSDVADARRRAHARARAMRDASMRPSHRRQCHQSPVASPTPRGPHVPQWDNAKIVGLPGTCENFGSAMARPGIALQCPHGTAAGMPHSDKHISTCAHKLQMSKSKWVWVWTAA
eukprot:scaffold15732_cov137-Isochrysis_galbana.AAC.9